MDQTFELPSGEGYTIYTKSQCGFCIKSKNLLKAEPYTMIDCDEYLLEDKEAFLAFIETICGKSYRTFPIIFKDGKFLGGFSETKTHYEKEKAFTDESAP
uniref:Glutaredoxin domain-containing protein n=1 Tax=viral metagenome TaxID=1070528 RepID=A0A6C0JI22_9ZZZZ